ncbi:bifunctional helix-turn-helix domain-containing protein/methylated-DNA--[protein]-cysteine S-methyltransferase [Ponticaulis sp.]|uniref:bifunctional helix-turn-helix domain-containing protein/methylated-DNA--[protein]-cysteine S-methyltransferase n=1 Tax=Ponticaulis sp. TaxID=2020902 RepID=UPI000B67A0A0|nr:bifunctional helix-turn-helix domain-containing protein/methylated-DNA--[protein]-cysteine S-methyltransferase [Ponticaulis sp.]MAI91050.1 6-O-methylguanine DNA methyltransferase [Ponticaulis sp.]OUX98383.1 MAG: 6-O-methylguanine DNA methyltransferase [Hyphomonadaceae bacterium TMED5]|tara:strand:- start:87415 stop:88323 length:909 start_codon:yes stop_codon:yes gene_type:complete
MTDQTKQFASLDERCAAYDRMADALLYLGDNWKSRPTLAQASNEFGLSPFHFQREFSLWSGLSPKQYVSAHAHAAAGELLREGASVLETSFEIEASGPSRLHDLFIAHEALTPGEAASGGRNVTLTIGRGPTPFGDGVFLFSDRGLTALGFIDAVPETPGRPGEKTGRSEKAAFEDIASRYPAADIIRDDAAAARFAEKVFEPGAKVPLALYGTPFRRQVWRALLEIPVGATCTYGQLASATGNPKSARATGTAVGANPISWFVPCHRALASDGRLHNYHWGVKRKRAMLAMEAGFRDAIGQ